MPNTLRKSERLDKKKVIEKMFAGGSRSFSVFPLRVVYLPVEELGKLIGSGDYCSACFDGKYPTKIPDDTRKDRFERKLSEL